MYTVGQFSRILRVSAKTLRWYDEISLFKPAKVDPANQYRYYSAAQVGAFQLILFLRDVGMGLDDIRLVLARGAGPEAFASVLAAQAEAVKSQIESAQATLSRIQQALKELRRDDRMATTSNIQVTVKEVQQFQAVSARRRIAIRDVGGLFAEAASKLRGAPAGPWMARYFDEDFDPENVDIEVLLPVDRGDTTLPAARVASYLHVGAYEGLSEAYGNLYGWLNDHLASTGRQIAGPVREIYLVGQESRRPPAEFVTEIQVPIEE